MMTALLKNELAMTALTSRTYRSADRVARRKVSAPATEATCTAQQTMYAHCSERRPSGAVT